VCVSAVGALCGVLCVLCNWEHCAVKWNNFLESTSNSFLILCAATLRSTGAVAADSFYHAIMFTHTEW
jgi:hypothetical protein